ncbi:hypothetical protein EMIHUDRAFT_437764 [Emiliania huxleyi CCMP1516]|uniref:Lipid-binding serum glycoprotein C-terminal domain-containing protein n=2 Tax=Emiliania huxleyi TaxID=2903 RepID=A0A0D3II58_EMIH1|nr:hypothetical protein EMIHUDRAFT_437764 [Emiliania huxleyi CCMP1516]EOD10943.1 hypothetical protein EMIHUDRAFT_437764 [Emiliania huxleyi CCMP1516]|eukprot:XP_005763372.1 hypothetical protein EMIHUDRAFT_437764 [Emiliania huxleyi CCMP1516]
MIDVEPSARTSAAKLTNALCPCSSTGGDDAGTARALDEAPAQSRPCPLALRLLPVALVLLLFTAFAGPTVASAAVQFLVDRSVLTVTALHVAPSESDIGDFGSGDPGSAGPLDVSISRSDLTVAIQTTGELRLWLLPVACTVERMDLSVAHASGGAAPVGSFQALSPLAVGFGGRVPLHVRGALEVANLTALHELSARIITAPELSLSVAGSVTVRAWPGLLFEGITLAKQFRLRGMGGLAARTTALHLSESYPGSEVTLEAEVEAQNPSSFELTPLGEIAFAVQTAAGSQFAAVATDGLVSMRQGALSYTLRGPILSPPEDVHEFERLSADYAAGRTSDVHAVFTSIGGVPLYSVALQGVALDAKLPGRLLHFFRDVGMHVDVNAAAIHSLAGLAGDHAHGYVGDHSHGLIEKDPTPLAELEETVYIGQLSNPLNITTTVLAVEVNVTYLGTAVGRVSVPEVSPPLVLGPFESRRSRAFPLLLKAPAATLSRMMADLLKDGEIEVGLYSALDLTFGPDRVRLPYVEELITVALENKGLAGSAAAMQLVDKLAGGQVSSSLGTTVTELGEAGQTVGETLDTTVGTLNSTLSTAASTVASTVEDALTDVGDILGDVFGGLTLSHGRGHAQAGPPQAQQSSKHSR